VPSGGPAGVQGDRPGDRLGDSPSDRRAEGATDRRAELHARRRRLEAGGGGERAAEQHARGKLTARERLGLLFDPGSFAELGLFVEHRAREFGLDGRELPADAVVTGYGTVGGRPCYAFSQDFTVLGGTLGEAHAAKIMRVQDLAMAAGAPLVGLNDSGGARIQEGIDALNGFAGIFRRNVRASGVVPQISVILGPCAGGAVYSPALTDFVFMVDGTSQMFITGPEVIRAVTGEEVSFEELGGARTHNQRSGVAHFFCRDEPSCFELIKRLLGHLPAHNLQDPPRGPAEAPPPGAEDALVAALPADPERPYDVRRVIEAVVDRGEFLEVHALWAQNAVVGLARIEGRPVGVVANQPRVLAGTLDIEASDKIARFVRTCDCFNLPLVTLVDTPGYLPGRAQEHGGIIRHGAKVLYAYAEATVPKVSLILRKAYGGAYIAMCCRGLGADLAAAWPQAEVAVMGPEAACNIVFRREIAAAADPEAARRERIEEYRRRFASPYTAAGRGYVDAVIDPRETRSWLAGALAAMAGKREEGPGKKHGNVPL
jgi:acetyl-CoA carboxylase carboxyltransferase component